ncbi:MAG: glycosyltransferase [Veillonella dispar]|jgi:glycosyltransferase involved in cell wall biosynthesis/polysaccharide pyruvyl transferase WcaK-like protein|nr:glycosyltransferase [Veillonella dispar]
MKTIAIFGAFGVPNVGDDAILQANLEWIESRYGSNCRVYIFTKDATYTSLYIKTRLNIIPVTYIHDVTKSQWYDSDKIENELEQIKIGNINSTQAKILHEIFNDIDLLHIAGGGYLNSKWKDIISEVYELVKFAKLYHKPYIFTGLSLTLDSKDLKKVREIIESAELIDFRDDTYRELGNVSGLPIYETCDDAINLSIDDIQNDFNNLKYINILFHEWSGYKDNISDKINTVIVPFINYILSENNVDIVNILGFSNGDLQLWNNIDFGEYSDCIRYIDCTLLHSSSIKALVKYAQYNISSRFHMAVFSLSSETPIYSIVYDTYYDNKISSIHKLYHSKEYIFIDNLSLENLIDFERSSNNLSQHIISQGKNALEIYHKKMDCIYTVYDGISINFSDTIKLAPIPVNISVIIPVYNMGAYIREALDSVISQTLKNIEIICINDGSTDNSIDILNEYSQRDPRIKVINKENEGVASARNDAIRVANGEYLFFLDPDDWLPDSDVLHDLYEAAKKHNVLVCGGNFVEYASGYINDRWSGANSKYTFDREGFIDYYNYQFDYGWVRFLYKRQFLIDNNLWIPKLTFFEDPQFFVRVMTCAKNFYVLPRPTYCYRSGHHSYELSYTKVIDLIHSMTAIIKIAKENGYKNLIALEKYRLSHDYSWEVIKYLKGIRNEELKSALRNLNLVLFDGKDSIEYEMYDVIIARKDYEIWIQSSINADIKGRIKQKVKKILKRVLPKQVINMLKRMR